MSSKQPDSDPASFNEASGSLASSGLDGEGRRWDDPPSEVPPHLNDNSASCVILIAKRTLRITDHSFRGGREIQQLAFTPSDSHIIVMAPNVQGGSASAISGNAGEPSAQGSSTLSIFNSLSGMETNFAQNHKAIVFGGFACIPMPDDAIAAPLYRHEAGSSGPSPVRTPRLQVFDLALKKRRLKIDLPIQAPLAYSPDGLLIASASAVVPSRIQLYDVIGERILPRRQIPHHIDDVTHLAVVPDGTALASLSKDGTGRLTSLATGRVLGKFEVETRHAPRMLQVSPDGQLIASVWGWDVVLWYPATSKVVVYNVNAARQTEGWPLCISPDCRFLACRTEDGFDVMDLATGRFLGEITGFTGERSLFISAAAFNSDGGWLVAGKSNGEVVLYEVILT